MLQRKSSAPECSTYWTFSVMGIVCGTKNSPEKKRKICNNAEKVAPLYAHPRDAPVVQWIEWQIPVLVIWVRFPSGVRQNRFSDSREAVFVVGAPPMHPNVIRSAIGIIEDSRGFPYRFSPTCRISSLQPIDPTRFYHYADPDNDSFVLEPIHIIQQLKLFCLTTEFLNYVLQLSYEAGASTTFRRHGIRSIGQNDHSAT